MNRPSDPVTADDTAPEQAGPVEAPRRTRLGRVVAWALWDWGASAYSTIVVTFVIAPYLTEDVAAGAPPGSLSGATWLSIALAAAGLLIALLAPVIGQRADAGGRRKLSLGLWSALTVLSAAGLFFVRDEYSFLWLGLILMAAGSVFSEFAGVSYNAMLRQVSTPATVGKVSGFGWAAGYVGGIGVLLGAYLLFIQPEVGLFGVTADGGLKFRVLAVVAAIWFAVWSIPVLIAVPEIAPTDRAARVGFFASYGVLIRQIRGLYANARHTVWFLLASAIFRDGLAAVFAFGAVLARSVYGLSAGEVIIFGVAANVVAAAGAFVAGFLEDRVGPKLIILVSLGGLIVAAIVLLFAQGSTMFWIFGLILCLWVGPAQSSSRTFLVRLSPLGHEGQLFGLYATTGRAVSFLAPSLFGLFAGLFASDRMGIIGIALVLLIGAIALLGVRRPPREAPIAAG